MIDDFSFADTITGDILFAPSPIVFLKEDKVWDVVLAKVWKELRNYELPWRYMTVEQCIISFLVALLILISSTYDVYSDGRLAQTFIVGAYYIYYSHSRVSTKYMR